MIPDVMIITHLTDCHT